MSPNKAKEEATGGATEAETAEGTTPAERPAKDVIREMFEQGKSRSEIAKALGVSYQRVFSLTKGQTNAATGDGGARPKVILEGLEGENARFNGVARIEAIRTLFGEGLKVGPIAKAISTKEKPVSYQIVFQATRQLREAAEATDAPEGEAEEVEEGAEGTASDDGEDEPEE